MLPVIRPKDVKVPNDMLVVLVMVCLQDLFAGFVCGICLRDLMRCAGV